MTKHPALTSLAQVAGVSLAVAAAVSGYSHMTTVDDTRAQEVVAALAAEHDLVVVDLPAVSSERDVTPVTVRDGATLRPALVGQEKGAWALYVQSGGGGYELVDRADDHN